MCLYSNGWGADKFSEVLQFFDGEWKAVGTVARKPGLYCDSTWPIQETNGVHATARDIDGKPIWIDGEPQSISKLYGEVIKAGQLPFWSELMKCYEFEAPENAGQYCANNPESKGATSDGRYTTGLNAYDSKDRPALAIVSLCPHAFSDPKDLAKLPENEQDMKDYEGKAVEKGTPLSSVLPQSSTLLHEAFHVTQGGLMKSEDEKCKSSQIIQLSSDGNADQCWLHIDAVAECLAYKQADALENPENYVLFALAMWYREKGNWNFSKGSAMKIVE